MKVWIGGKPSLAKALRCAVSMYRAGRRDGRGRIGSAWRGVAFALKLHADVSPASVGPFTWYGWGAQVRWRGTFYVWLRRQQFCHDRQRFYRAYRSPDGTPRNADRMWGGQTNVGGVT